jgi:hypothetical protein
MATAAVLLMFAAYSKQGCQHRLVVGPMMTLTQRECCILSLCVVLRPLHNSNQQHPLHLQQGFQVAQVAGKFVKLATLCCAAVVAAVDKRCLALQLMMDPSHSML